VDEAVGARSEWLTFAFAGSHSNQTLASPIHFRLLLHDGQIWPPFPERCRQQYHNAVTPRRGCCGLPVPLPRAPHYRVLSEILDTDLGQFAHLDDFAGDNPCLLSASETGRQVCAVRAWRQSTRAYRFDPARIFDAHHANPRVQAANCLNARALCLSTTGLRQNKEPDRAPELFCSPAKPRRPTSGHAQHQVQHQSLGTSSIGIRWCGDA